MGTGAVLTLRFSANTNGDDEAYAFYNMLVTGLVGSFVAAFFNTDGAVDGSDLAAWQSNFELPSGAMKSHGDADADGDVDGADFLAWQRQLSGANDTVSTAAVPEANSILLAAFSLSAATIRLRFSRAAALTNHRTQSNCRS
jgi:hypothetical protein